MNNFDLISDLHLTSIDDFDWENKATSLYCIVAGNVSESRSILYEFLAKIKTYYSAVLFVDGELEHKVYGDNFSYSYENLAEGISLIDGVYFLYSNIVVMHNTVILGANGWSTFDFSGSTERDITMQFLEERHDIDPNKLDKILEHALVDSSYLKNSIEKCQTLNDVVNIIVVSNAVPHYEFIDHIPDYQNTVAGDIIGNSEMTQCLTLDKISHWAFGRFEHEVDWTFDGVRYVNNPKLAIEDNLYIPKLVKM